MKLFCTLLLPFLFYTSTAQNTYSFTKIDSIVQTYHIPNAPGFSIGIVKEGQFIYSKGIGYANIQQQQANTDSSVFSIASIAKQFTAACVWSLMKENKISLNDDIRKYLPEFPFYCETIKIKHLLNHSSGIRNYHTVMELAGFDYDKQFHNNQYILDLACKQKGLNNRPGEKVIYGNTAYNLLAIIIERITGKNLNKYAQEKIFGPLGMKQTFYKTDSSYRIANKASGYIKDDNDQYIAVNGNQLTYGAGSVGSTVKDLAKWSNVLNGNDAACSSLTTFLVTVDTLQSGEIPKYARGVMVDEYKKLKTIHHSGYGLGGQSQLLAVPAHNMAIIILGNLESIDPTPLSYTLLDILLPQQNTPSQAFSTSHQTNYTTAYLKQFTGQYKEQNSDMKMEFFLENDTLKALGSLGKKAIPIVATDEAKFIRINNQNVSYQFMPKNIAADLIVYFGGSPFYFSKATFIKPQSVSAGEYTGTYYSPELSVEYTIYVQEGNLYLNYPGHNKIKLSAGQKDEFGNGQRVLYHFERNKKNEVNRFYLSAEGTVKNIEFNKK